MVLLSIKGINYIKMQWAIYYQHFYKKKYKNQRLNLGLLKHLNYYQIELPAKGKIHIFYVKLGSQMHQISF